MTKLYCTDYIVYRVKERSGAGRKPKYKLQAICDTIGEAVEIAFVCQRGTSDRIVIYLNGHEVHFSRIVGYNADGYEL